ncbi:MAG: AAA family ATPase [Chloroflexi bacterium]|nr:AAA family ATPase [Chloroflexota bacterium]
MAKKIALFNHKGGVSKTTTTFNLGWMMASKGKRAILVDTDPQCNLTGMVLGYRGPTELATFYKREIQRNIKAGLAPAFESRPQLIEAVSCVEVDGQPGLFLLPGHIGLAEYEVTLGIAQELTQAIQTLQNLPGALAYLLDKTAERFQADIVLIDMSPSLSAINQNLLMTSDYFIVPTSPDYFSVMAIDSLTSVLPNWHKWSMKAQSMGILQNASYPYPTVTPRFLGTIVQKYRPRGKVPAKAFQEWINEIAQSVSRRLYPALKGIDMVLPEIAYNTQGIGPDFCLATIADFNSLIARSQKAKRPVFALTEEMIGQEGVVLERTLRSRDEFRRTFSELADKVSGLVTYAEGA